MYLAINLKNIENQLLTEFRKKNPNKTRKRQRNSENYMELLTAGNISQILRSESTSEEKTSKKIVGILFADPNVSIAKSEIVPHLDYLYHLTDEHLDLYCAGYNAYLPQNEEYRDNKSIITSVNEIPWKFSTKSFIQVEREIESISKWKKKDGCTLLLFNVKISRNNIHYDFNNCLDWNLKEMLESKDISSIRVLIDNIVENIKTNASIWETSDKFGMEILGNCVKDSTIQLLPEKVRDAYRKAEHFAIKNYSK